MSTTMTLDEAEISLRKLIAELGKGEEVTITEGDQIVARIMGERPSAPQRPGPGLAKGMIAIVADDEEHLKDFSEYMP